jgi:hypothetical protein
MNAMTVRALSLGLLVAVWTAISHYARLPMLLWPVIVGVGCFLATDGGTRGLQNTLAGMISGVVWALIAYSVSRSLGRNNIVDALIYGTAVVGMVLQARVPLLSFTPGVVVGAAAAMGAGVRALQGGVRVAAALAIGAGLGYAAEYIAERTTKYLKAR